MLTYAQILARTLQFLQDTGAATYDATEVNILLAGGDWHGGVYAGVGSRNSSNVATNASRYFGARLEFIG